MAKKKLSKNEQLGIEVGSKREVFLKNTKTDLERQNETYEHHMFLNKKIIVLLEEAIKKEKEKFK